MFKDYIRTEGKRAIDKFKGDDSNLISYHTARKYDSYGGVLKPNILFLDIDTKEESEKLLKIIKELNINSNVLETTKGAHFYFERPKELEKNKIDWFSPIGITVTVKVGNKNVVEPLKQTIGTLLKKFKSDLEKIDLSNLSGGTYFINDLEWYHRYHYEICVLERQLLRGNEFKKSKLDRIQELKNRINLIKRIVQLDSDKLIREIMHFKYIENYSLDDVAILLGYSKSTVKKFHAFATSKLKIENDEMYNLFYSNYSEEERLKDVKKLHE